MKKIDINKLHIEYYHRNKKYYRVIYDPKKSKKNMFDSDIYYKEISFKTAMNWVRKGAKLWEWHQDWDDYRDYDDEYYKELENE